jgi:hypothetical protein
VQSRTAAPTIPGMRRLLYVNSALVLVIGIPLYLLSPQTETYFAWTIHPPLTAAVLGAGYWASFVLELLSARERLWARTRVVVPAVLLFSTLTWPSPWSMPTASISTAGSSSPGLAPGGG